MSERMAYRGIDKGTCRSCGASIVWVSTLGGTKAPFEPDPDGLFVLVNGVARHVGPPSAQIEFRRVEAEERAA